MTGLTRHWRSVWRLNRATHRDVGYFCSALVIAYCVSGIALNHIDAWNPDFVIHKETVTVPAALRTGELDEARVIALSGLVGEARHRVFDVPVPGQVKIYYEDATLHVRLDDGVGTYERVSRRPLFYEVNVLHRNTFKPWKWGADVFAILLVLMNVTGLFVLRGRQGLSGRGKWLIAAGALPPFIVLVLHG